MTGYDVNSFVRQHVCCWHARMALTVITNHLSVVINKKPQFFSTQGPQNLEKVRVIELAIIRPVYCRSFWGILWQYGLTKASQICQQKFFMFSSFENENYLTSFHKSIRFEGRKRLLPIFKKIPYIDFILWSQWLGMISWRWCNDVNFFSTGNF